MHGSHNRCLKRLRQRFQHPDPAESDRTESHERSDYDSRGDKEAREEYLSVEASDNLGNWNLANKSETSGIGGTK